MDEAFDDVFENAFEDDLKVHSKMASLKRAPAKTKREIHITKGTILDTAMDSDLNSSRGFVYHSSPIYI